MMLLIKPRSRVQLRVPRLSLAHVHTLLSRFVVYTKGGEDWCAPAYRAPTHMHVVSPFPLDLSSQYKLPPGFYGTSKRFLLMCVCVLAFVFA